MVDKQKVKELGCAVIELLSEMDASPQEGINTLLHVLATCVVTSDLDKAYVLNILGNNIDRIKGETNDY
jgi:hypothetical protein